ncbi:MAG: multifunctional oxoglutarate decarboxylase/oxoglutarate dehydrogenase thiamine pyrophosphate-binding subunit/dihydrolipoyllysine-residue succinyltransferase subunit, partial [Propionibacteriaceae bacterium]|nr:multifunctional oxoglutarate decarboxylase/oxoglutarate dehydrogenase thiamine pyrophosphate-binding subunit/dihydrolipoyllysine-residue succinyltransferase subunit [Propionibacteriaceae bacterium]
MNNELSVEYGDNSWLIMQMRERLATSPDTVPDAWKAYFSEGSGHAVAPPSATSVPPATADTAATPATPVPTVEPRESRSESPATPGDAGGIAADVPLWQSPPSATPLVADDTPTRTKLRGVPLRAAQRMADSLEVPTATSFRAVPMKLATEERNTINNFLRRTRGGKVSFTHLVAYALIQAVKANPEMNRSFEQGDDGPYAIQHPHINLGIAIDLTAKDGTRQLLVPVLKRCETMDFAAFWAAYEDLITRSRGGGLGVDDLSGATCTITNPGSIGTNASRPRLLPGQGFIVGVGAIDYPAPFQGASSHNLAELGVSKATTLTSTYDHRVIQGAQSGELLAHIHRLLLGEDGFYEAIFEALRIPYPPLAWATDITPTRTDQTSKEARVVGLIEAYRTFGHLMADTDPLEYRRHSHPDLELASHGLTLWDLDRRFPARELCGVNGQLPTLREIIDRLRDSYCHTTGIEYMHIQDPEQRHWWQQRVEREHTPRPREEQLRILDQLCEAEVFETFLQTKYVGQTRFSLEGAESALVVLAAICQAAAAAKLAEVAIGMPNRGRLNVLTNIVGKLYSQVFREFDNRAPDIDQISGDVLYHLGSEGSFTTATGNSVRVSVAANPSHLEAVAPVLEGIARAKNDRLEDPSAYRVLPVLVHGDAAFAAQGIVYEVLQLSQLRAYRVGGTIHLVVNNQVGFTTAPVEGRSSVYCTDVAKTVQAPVLHVNGDDPDACARAAELAFDYRQAFGKDVVIDMVCYRRRGHNEGDDPSFTQPCMYDLIEQKRPVRQIFSDALVGRGDITQDDADEYVARFRDRLEQVFSDVRDPGVPREPEEYRIAPRYPTKQRAKSAPAITRDVMDTIAGVYQHLPEGFQVHPKVQPQLDRRVAMIHDGPIDWATAELLAFGSLLIEQHQVRVVGQDTRRGTFAQRFSAVVDRTTNEAWVPLKHLTTDQAPFDIFDSALNEYAAMGFEYGYSVAAPDALVAWEAQYGDFSNGAQTIIDEFVVSGHAKWAQQSGVVLLLPHGYEGQGPDHSSARLERWLQMAEGDNMAVAQPSTPASYFHLLRTHTLVNWHRPLVVATPKSMLRNKAAASTPDEFISGFWRPALPDDTIADPATVRRILLCSGKIRWDLMAKRAELGLTAQVAIISLEQLYPLPDEALAKALAKYPHVSDFVWAQDEPDNQGPWPF